MKAKIIKMIKNNQYSRTGWIRFYAESDAPISSDEAEELQLKEGWHPLGYGFYNFHTDIKDGKYLASWKCSLSCD
jgi:hypothetical protein